LTLATPLGRIYTIQLWHCFERGAVRFEEKYTLIERRTREGKIVYHVR
jgi:hypothetical protein